MSSQDSWLGYYKNIIKDDGFTIIDNEGNIPNNDESDATSNDYDLYENVDDTSSTYTDQIQNSIKDEIVKAFFGNQASVLHDGLH